MSTQISYTYSQLRESCTAFNIESCSDVWVAIDYCVLAMFVRVCGGWIGVCLPDVGDHAALNS